jgi:uncharacterized protein (DUF433 family)
MAEPTTVAHIEIRPGICGGKPCVAGTRIRVQDIRVWHELQGLTPEEIIAQYPQLSLADVHAALTYYHDHRDEIQRQIREAADLVASLRAGGLSPLREKITGS